MASERGNVISRRASSLWEKFKNRKYRHSYVVAHTRRFLAHQMRMFRGDRSQTDFGDVLGKQQTVVSRLEDPAYGKWTLQTLFEIAEKLDIAVFVRFVDHKTFLRLSKDFSDSAAAPAPYDKIASDSEKPALATASVDANPKLYSRSEYATTTGFDNDNDGSKPSYAVG